MKIRLFGVIAALLLAAGIMVPSAAAAHGHIRHISGTHPVVFIHGGSGVGAQFESQAQRFESNGYPAEYVYAFDWDSTLKVETREQVWARLDQLLASIQETTGDDQIDLVGHSRGSDMSYQYLESSPERAAKVARFISLDSGSCPKDRIPAGVPTLGIWAGRGHCVGCSIVGATNVYIPNQTHVQLATSAETFVEMYEYLVGKAPATSDIVPEFPLFIKLSGKAVFFPTNLGVPDGTVQVWPVDGRTGKRLTSKPVATYPLGGDGSWGPVTAVGGLHYEFTIVRAGQFTHHFYYEPFLRSDHLIRLQTEPLGTGLGAYTDVSDNQTDLIILRNKEIWGDQGAENDVLEVNGANVVSPATHPISQFVNATFVFDKGKDGVNHLGVRIFPFYAISFLAGVDLYIPGTNPPDTAVAVVLTPRVGGHAQTINVPNWASSTDRVTLQFNDFNQGINSWLEYVLSLLRR